VRTQLVDGLLADLLQYVRCKNAQFVHKLSTSCVSISIFSIYSNNNSINTNINKTRPLIATKLVEADLSIVTHKK
jgi:hypothetical protein